MEAERDVLRHFRPCDFAKRLGVEDEQVDLVLGLVNETCHPRTQIVNPMPPIMEPGEFFMPYPLEVEVGGATVFVLPVERFERL